MITFLKQSGGLSTESLNHSVARKSIRKKREAEFGVLERHYEEIIKKKKVHENLIQLVYVTELKPASNRFKLASQNDKRV